MAKTLQELSYDGYANVFHMTEQIKVYVAKEPFPLHLPKGVEPVYRLVIFEKPIYASQLFADFVGTGFDAVKFHNFSILYQNCTYDPTQPVGWSLQADLIFDEAYGVIHDVLEGICGVTNPRLHITCDFEGAAWASPLAISSFILEGHFPEISASPCPLLTFTSVGVQLVGYNGFTWSDGGVTPSKTYGADFFGSLRVAPLGTSSPLDLTFHILKVGDILQLSAISDDVWDNAFGMKGLKVQSFKVSSILTRGHNWNSLALDVEAILRVRDVEVALEGSLSADRNFDVYASVSDWALEDIFALYTDLFGHELAVPELGISIESLTLSISSRSGLCIALHNLKVGDYAVASATLQFDSNGAVLRGELSSGQLVLDKELSIAISDAYVQLEFAKGASGKQAGLMLGGTFAFMDYKLQVGAHLYKLNNETHYTLFGAFDDASSTGTFQIGKLSPGLENTPLRNIALTNAAIVVSSRDDAELSVFASYSRPMVPVYKGIQICAILSNCDQINKLSKAGAEPMLYMSLAWRDGEFSVSVIPAIPLTIDLGGGVKTEPVSLHITVGNLPALKARTGLQIPVAGREDPLRFIAEIELNEVEATLTGQLAAKGGWNNPFNLARRLTIGPNLILSASILYVGAPGGLGFAGGLQIGKVTGQVAFKVDAEPSKQLFTVEVGNVDLLDIVALTRDIVDADIPDPPNLIQFEAFKMYVCPVGVTLGTVRYPQGFSFSCRGVILFHPGDINVHITKSGAKLGGFIDRFELGPLSMSGMEKPNPSFDLEISGARQAGTLDGKIELFGSPVAVLCAFQLTPKFILRFQFDLKFAELFTFQVQADPTPNGSSKENNLPDDYLLTADFRQDGCEKISHEINELFRKVHKDETEIMEAVERTLTVVREEWEDKIRVAQSDADAAHDRYTKKLAAAEAANENNQKPIKAKVVRLRKRLDDARESYDRDLSEAKANLRSAEQRRAYEIADAEENLRRTRKEWDEKLESAQSDLSHAQRDLSSAFDSAQRDLDRAKDKVDSIQGEIDRCHRRLGVCNNASIFDFGKKAEIPVLWGKIGSLETSRAVAKASLDVAKAAVSGGEVVSRQGALEAAKGAVEATKSGGKAAVDAASASLDATRESMDFAVNRASDAVDGVRSASGKAVEVASDALKSAESGAKVALNVAQRAIDAVKSGPEWVEYQAKSAALEVVKKSYADALELAKKGVGLGKDIANGIFNLAHWTLEMIGSLVVIKKVHLSLELGQAIKGAAFDAYVQGTINHEPFKYSISLDHKMAEEWIVKVFNRLVDDLKSGALSSLNL